VLALICLVQICEPEEMKKVTGLSIPHTSHCLGSGDIMISTMGDQNENPKGSQLDLWPRIIVAKIFVWPLRELNAIISIHFYTSLFHNPRPICLVN